MAAPGSLLLRSLLLPALGLVACGQASADAAPRGPGATQPALASPAAVPPAADGSPTPPQAWVDTRMPERSGRVHRVAPGGDVQAAIDRARPGDEIVLAAGATYPGPLVLRRKEGTTGWIVIRSDGALPPEGTRMTPALARAAARIVGGDAPNDPVVRTEAGAARYRLVGLEIVPADGPRTGTIVALGDGRSRGPQTTANTPRQLVLDRVLVHGGRTQRVHRCVGLNSAETAIVDSWIGECHAKGLEAHAVAGWNGPGPFKLVNNYLEGSGIGVLFGGARPSVSGLIPTDIEIRRNHFSRPASWRGTWTVKNLFELKSARRVLVEGNVFEHNWSDAQTGFALVWKSSAVRGTPWVVVEDVLFRHNVVRESDAGLALAARPEREAQPAGRIRLEHNLFVDIGSFGGSRNGRMLQLGGDLHDVVFERNTFLHTDQATHLATLDGRPDTAPMRGLVFRGNVATLGRYGIKGSGTVEGTASLARFTSDRFTFEGNVLIGRTGGAYPDGTRRLRSLAAAGFVAPAVGDLRLRADAEAAGAGADAAAVREATAGVVLEDAGRP